jgi:hypothetical protein
MLVLDRSGPGFISAIVVSIFLSTTQHTGDKFATGANLPPVSTTQSEPVAKFAPGVVDTGGKFAAGGVDTGGKLPPAPLTPAANLPLGQICHGCQQHKPNWWQNLPR